jgi:hypothetical protein
MRVCIYVLSGFVRICIQIIDLGMRVYTFMYEIYRVIKKIWTQFHTGMFPDLYIVSE